MTYFLLIEKRKRKEGRKEGGKGGKKGRRERKEEGAEERKEAKKECKCVSRLKKMIGTLPPHPPRSSLPQSTTF